MITLSTLNFVSEQQVFDQVAKHLLEQNKQSATGNDCLYRGPEGLKCAAGCLISETEYTPEMDNVHGAWCDVVRMGFAPSAHCKLICDLQFIHDIYRPHHWRKQLAKVAKTYKLNDSVLRAEVSK